MITRADAIFDGGPLRPLEQFKLEDRERVARTMATLDDEFQREFGMSLAHHQNPVTQAPVPEACGPEAWGKFLDLSTI